MQKAMSFNEVAIVFVKGNHYRIHFWYMSKDKAINLLTNADLSKKVGHCKVYSFFIVYKR